MEKKIDFLKTRTAAQLANLVDRLASDLCYEIVNNLEDVSQSSDEITFTRHDVALINVVSLCDSIGLVLDELKSLI